MIWNPETRRLGADSITGKAMDDRAALAIATEAGRRLAYRSDLANEVWPASTVQEENGMIGAASVADFQEFDRCIKLDAGLTGDIPGPNKTDFPCKLGVGPKLVHQNSSCHYSRRMIAEPVGCAAAHDIPVQQAVFQNHGSDGASSVGRDVETLLLTYPTGYVTQFSPAA